MGKLTIPWVLLLLFQATGVSQTSVSPGASSDSSRMPRAVNALFDYLTMAGTETAADFKPLTQSEQNRIYLKSLINPVLYFKSALSAGLDQRNNKPVEWGQGASGYGKRFANITGQYAIQRTATFGLSSLLGEDNRISGLVRRASGAAPVMPYRAAFWRDIRMGSAIHPSP